ncbi:hypothetical protein B0H15DRAFT_804879 [Mycena belliarum]|uniref:Uncharacterized protein n=1 Tax=Mycena belliarum TaxID=1033014 RepID=A0AAD6XKV6_9AGAR|nr:hypothetical protein B0H15DRAFT_804879 [Mycena belliae]
MAARNEPIDTFSHAFLATEITNPAWVVFNSRHASIQRVSLELFQLVAPNNSPVLISATTIRLFADYNVALTTGADIPDIAPIYYNDFAAYLNAHDESGFGWAYINDDGTIAWTDGMAVARPEAFYVRDHEIYEAYLPPNHVAVTQAYFEKAERLHAQDEFRQNKWFQERTNKCSRQSGPAPDSKEAMADFHRRRQSDQTSE